MNHNQPFNKSILVLGATGGIGGAVTRAFLDAGWRVKALTRRNPKDQASLNYLSGVEWVLGDAMHVQDVVRATKGVDCIFHGVNPPRYQRWRQLAIPMLASSVAAARASGARFIFPGTIYNFGPDAGHLLKEDSPQNPRTRKGQVRLEMEVMLQRASQQDVRVLVVRAGDFFGWQAPSSWFQTLLIRPQRKVGSVWFPGEPDVGHAWAYLPDLAQTILRLAEAEQALGTFETFHFHGHWTPRSIEMAESIQRVCGNPGARIRQLPWPLLYAAAPFVPILREMIEMRYLWRVPIRLDNHKLVRMIGDEPHTPLDEAVKTSLKHLGCC